MIHPSIMHALSIELRPTPDQYRAAYLSRIEPILRPFEKHWLDVPSSTSNSGNSGNRSKQRNFLDVAGLLFSKSRNYWLGEGRVESRITATKADKWETYGSINSRISWVFGVHPATLQSIYETGTLALSAPYPNARTIKGVRTPAASLDNPPPSMMFSPCTLPHDNRFTTKDPRRVNMAAMFGSLGINDRRLSFVESLADLTNDCAVPASVSPCYIQPLGATPQQLDGIIEASRWIMHEGASYPLEGLPYEPVFTFVLMVRGSQMELHIPWSMIQLARPLPNFDTSPHAHDNIEFFWRNVATAPEKWIKPLTLFELFYLHYRVQWRLTGVYAGAAKMVCPADKQLGILTFGSRGELVYPALDAPAKSVPGKWMSTVQPSLSRFPQFRSRRTRFPDEVLAPAKPRNRYEGAEPITMDPDTQQMLEWLAPPVKPSKLDEVPWDELPEDESEII